MFVGVDLLYKSFGNKVLSVEHKLLAVVGCAQSMFTSSFTGLKTATSASQICKNQIFSLRSSSRRAEAHKTRHAHLRLNAKETCGRLFQELVSIPAIRDSNVTDQ